MHFRSFTATALLLVAFGVPLRAATIESVNAGSSPHPTSLWAAVDAGWAYTPALTYWLTGVETKFRTADARTVTLEIFSGVPSSGGTLLRSSDFSPLSAAFAGGSFNPLTFIAGQQYFIGFRNIAGLGSNTTTANQGSQSLGAPYYDFDGSGSYGVHSGFATGDVDLPILLLNGEAVNGTAVPEPATFAFVSVPLIFLAATRRRRSKHEGS